MSRLLFPFQASSRALGDPFTDLHREMNRLFDDFVGGSTATQASQGSGLMAAPRLEVRESDQEICVCAELPGVRPSDVDLRLEANVLTIRGEKKNEVQDKKEEFHVMERSYGRFQRSLQLPYAPNPDQVRAEFEHGVLTIHLPKQPQQERSRRIEIQGGAAQGDPRSDAKVLNAPGDGDKPAVGQAEQATSQKHH